jgi:chromosome partitioning protein
VAHIIVLGNEKGGSGKSTTAMHVAVALLRAGVRVGALDLDLRQRSFDRYLENREAYAQRRTIALPIPERATVAASVADSAVVAEAEEAERFGAAIEALSRSCEAIVVDCPGSHSRYAQFAHAAAATLVTPLNDSLVDFDLLARVDPETGRVLGPSVYAEMVWKGRQRRAKAGLAPLDWVVLRNRVSMLDARNKRRVGQALQSLSRRIGFRIVPGLSERVVFREMFLSGLTLLDLRDTGTDALTLSQVAARQELRELVAALNIPGVTLSV